MDSRPEAALYRLGLAGLLLGHYPNKRVEAMEHLDFANDEFSDLHPALERHYGTGTS